MTSWPSTAAARRSRWGAEAIRVRLRTRACQRLSTRPSRGRARTGAHFHAAGWAIAAHDRLLDSETGVHSCWDFSSPVGAGSKRAHPLGDENAGLGADTPEAQRAADPRRRRRRRARGVAHAGAQDRRETRKGRSNVAVPSGRSRRALFVSRVRAGLAGRTAERGQLAVEMYARGLSTRGIEAAFRDVTRGSVLSRTAVSQATERRWQECEAFAIRDLGGICRDLPGHRWGRRALARPPAARSGGVLRAGGTEDRQQLMVHLAPGTKEGHRELHRRFQDLKWRGADPMPVVTPAGRPSSARSGRAYHRLGRAA